MAEDQETLRRRLYERTRDELIAGQRTNAELFDRSILTLSTGFLALSISFVPDIVPFEYMTHSWLLYGSWIALAASVVGTLLGVQYSQYIHKKLIHAAERYYLDNQLDAYDASERHSFWMDVVNATTGSVFVLAVVFTVTFACLNVRNHEMGKDERNRPGYEERGLPVNSFQKIPGNQNAPGSQPKTDAPAEQAPPTTEQSSTKTKGGD